MGDRGVRKYFTSIDGCTRGFRCNYCQFEYKGGGKNRLAYHLSGNDPRKDVKACTEVPPEVREEMRRHVLEIWKEKEKKQFLAARVRAGMRYKFRNKKHTASSETLNSVKPERESSGFDRDDGSRELKRRKPMNYGQAETVSSAEPEAREVPEPILIETSESSDGGFEEHTACAFCHSSETSAEYGSMLHCSNEELVSGQAAMRSDVIHVHKLCLNWSPQAFYVDEKVKSLTMEVTRGSTLKCSECGKYGATLGCYVKSCCRSYHVPCALRVSESRWDYENHFLLCPTHSSVRFPNEESKPSENVSNGPVVPAMVICEQSNAAALPDKERKWLLCGSALPIDEMILLVKFAKIDGCSVSKFWDPNVTHVIAATDESGACTRTVKVLMAILNGRWIVKLDWIKACIEAKYHIDEEPFEIIIDNYECRDGPKTGRLRAFNNAPKLFAGLNFYFVGDFLPSYKKDLEDLVIVGGGTQIKSREELSRGSGDVALIIYNVDLPEWCKPGEEALIMWRRASEAEEVATQSRSRVIGHTWLLDSIAAYKLQPFV